MLVMAASGGGSESALGLSNMVPRTPSKLVKNPPKPLISSSTSTITSPVTTTASTTSNTTATTTGKLTKPIPGTLSRSVSTSASTFPTRRQASTSTSSSAVGKSFLPDSGSWSTSQSQNPRQVRVFYPPRTRKSSHPAFSTPPSEARKEPGPRLPHPVRTLEEFQSPPERIAAMLRRHQSLSQPMSNNHATNNGSHPGVPVPVPQVPQMIPPPPRGDSIQGVKQKLLDLASDGSLLGGGSGEEVQDVGDGSRGSDASQSTVRRADKAIQHPELAFAAATGDGGGHPDARPTPRVLETANGEGVIHSSPPPMFSLLPDLHFSPTFLASPPSTPSRTPIVISPRTSWHDTTGIVPTPPRNYSLPFGTSLKSQATDVAAAVPRSKRTGLSSPLPVAQRLSAESSETSAGGDSALFSSPNSSLDLPPRILEDLGPTTDAPPSYTPREPEPAELLTSPELVAMPVPEPELIPTQRHALQQARRLHSPPPQLRASGFNSGSIPPPASILPPPPTTRRITRSQTLPLPGAMTTSPRPLPTIPTSTNPSPHRPTLSLHSSPAASVAPPLFYSGPSIVTSATSRPKSSSLSRPTTAPSTTVATSGTMARSKIESEKLSRPSTSPGIKPTHMIAPSLDPILLRPVLSHQSQSFSNGPRPTAADKNSDSQRRHSARPASSSSRPRSVSASGPASAIPSSSSRAGDRGSVFYDPQTGAPILPKSVRFSQWSDVRTFVHESWEPKGAMKPRYDRAPAGLTLGMGAEDIILADAGGSGGANKLSRSGSGKMRSLLGFVTKANR